MKRSTGSILGIAVSERELLIAEVSGAANPAINRTETFSISMPLADPKSTGQTLRQFLKDKGFTASKAIIGLPAKWITARSWQVPPATPSAANSILRLVAERQFPPELKDFVFDYAGDTNPTQPTTVLLLGTSSQRINQLVNVADAAGLNVLAVTSSSLALSAAMKQPERQKILVALNSESAELVVNSDTGPRSLRHLPLASEQLTSSNGSAAPAVATLGSELMRASLGSGEGVYGQLLLWDSLGLRADALATLRDRYSLNIATTRDLSALELNDATESAFGPAAALALLAVRRAPLPVDFIDSRLAPPKQNRMGRKAYWGAGVAAAILIGIAASLWSLHSQQNELDNLNARLNQMQPALVTARATDAKVTMADGWYGNRPSMLDCLDHITQAFPQEGSIWATNISVRDNGMGTVTGRARDQSAVLSVYDRMKNDPKFSRTTVDYIRQGLGGNARQSAFSISFTFKS
ncbi:MAG TPA: hypothetical protein VG722_04915 [Tepidisphaeraceae bacterium]|nr:hypothetical protein [Tepidisphaeraceae bacterium]